ncbi:MAG: endonuclease/exonuclease/phosphatase family protein [Myxococcales bacterium]|nr:endonuclease/exonuclease/phosphatase family protein [Myxococcales bacterium]
MATLNAWGLPAPVAADRRGRLPRIARWVEERGYDLAGLQELWHGALRLFDAPGLTLPNQEHDSGLALVTPHPVVSQRTLTFEAERGFDAWKAKGVLVAEVDAGAPEPLVVGVTHLQAGGSARAAAVRELQVDELLAALPEGRPTVLMGDFNLYEGQPADQATHQRLVDAGFVDVGEDQGAVGGTYPGLPDRFDRIWVRAGSHCLVADRAAVVDPQLSDHLAVEADLTVGI